MLDFRYLVNCNINTGSVVTSTMVSATAFYCVSLTSWIDLGKTSRYFVPQDFFIFTQQNYYNKHKLALIQMLVVPIEFYLLNHILYSIENKISLLGKIVMFLMFVIFVINIKNFRPLHV